VNLIGTVPKTLDVLGIPHAHLHLYGKEPRAGRKLGHITLVNPSSASEQELLKVVG
jgi:5-(carboxyamino)imidazole ribonucleotide synthase